MANYQLLKADIDEKVYQNGAQEITGANLNSVLNEMVTTLGAEYQFAGVATKDTNPGSPDAKVFYIANGKGTYTNFGGINVTEDEVVVLYWDSAWHKVATGIASNEKLTELGTQVIYDVTANNNGATFASLSALLSDENLSTLIPSAVRCGGMSIRFIQGSVPNSDNKYVQYFLTKDEWSLNEGDWEKMNIENEVKIISNSLDSVIPLEIGAISGVDGKDSANTARIRTTTFIKAPFSLTVNSGYVIRTLFRYTLNGSFVDYSSIAWNRYEQTDKNYLYRLVFNKSNEADVTQDDLNNIINTYTSDIQTKFNSLNTAIKKLDSVSSAAIETVEDSLYEEHSALTPASSANGFRLDGNTGIWISDSIGQYKAVAYKINEGEIYKVSGAEKFQFQSSSSTPIAAPSNRIGKTYLGDTLVKAPAGSSYLLISTLIATTPTVYEMIALQCSPNTPVDYNGVSLQNPNLYPIYNGDLREYASFTTFRWNVSNIRKIRLHYTSSNSNVLASMKYAIYSTDDESALSSATCVSIGDAIQGSYDIEVSIPDNAVTLIATGLDSDYPKAEIIEFRDFNSYFNFELSKYPFAPIKFTKSNDVIIVTSSYGNNHTFGVEWRKKGNNNIFDIYKFYKDGVVILTTATDWTGPYQVAALTNIDGDKPTSYEMTGGNHAYDVTSGTPTGRTLSIKLYADGKEITDTNAEGYCSRLEIVWKNRVQAYNTAKEDGSGREVLEEIQTAIFDGYKWERLGKIIPLEQIRIMEYYGMQCTYDQVWDTGGYFVGGTNNALLNLSENNVAGNRTPNEFLAYGANDELRMGVDITYDLGDRRFYASDGTKGLRNSGSVKKAYAFLISATTQGGTSYHMFDANTILSFRGYYIFRPKTM